MCVATFFKIGNRWFLDFPEYIDNGGKEEDLERVSGFAELLDLYAKGKDSISLKIDALPFEDADMAFLIGSSGGRTGGYYHLQYLHGQNIDLDFWLDQFIYYSYNELPDKLFFKIAED